MARPHIQHDGAPRESVDRRPVPISVDEESVERVGYFVDSDTADAAMRPGAIDQLLALAGARSDFDEGERVDVLDRIRRESKPAPPIGDLSTICEALSAGHWTVERLPARSSGCA